MDNARRPLIGVTGHRLESASGYTSITAKEAYLSAVRLAGGLPIVIQPVRDEAAVEETLDRLDGVLFTGGRDIDPAAYGQTILNETVEPEPDRDAFELALARAAYRRDIPVLAICRGCQVINVALGGTLWQDLPAQRPAGLPHRQQAPRGATSHSVRLQAGSRLAALLGREQLEVNSFHHQAARDLPAALLAAGYSPDGILEAFEAPQRRFVLAVQWHPEDLAATHPEHLRLFQSLVDAARFK